MTTARGRRGAVVRRSALPPKADILRAVAKSLLLTQSGHPVANPNSDLCEQTS